MNEYELLERLEKEREEKGDEYSNMEKYGLYSGLSEKYGVEGLDAYADYLERYRDFGGK